jgi:hypothetical protein
MMVSLNQHHPLIRSAKRVTKIVGLIVDRRLKAIMGNALLAEYESVKVREALLKKSRLCLDERKELFDIFFFGRECVCANYQWRPNWRASARVNFT